MRTLPYAAALGVITLSCWNAGAVQLTDASLEKVYNVMNNISIYSWENGTRSQAILEFKYPSLSIFSPSAPLPLPSSLTGDDIPEILALAKWALDNRPVTNTSTAAHNGTSLVVDGAAGDPASLGIAALLANFTTDNAAWNGIGYGTAAWEELNYLLYDVPRSPEGAISHRTDQVQLWSDNVYMVPPFLAYYGALSGNQTLLQMAYQQISLYRDVLLQQSGLWMHITNGTGAYDPGLWATGNAWVAAGIVRVIATILRSEFSSSMSSEISDLQNWAEEVLSNAQGYISGNGLLHNYINDTSTFEDSASSALMAAAGLRLSTLNLTDSYINMSLTLLSAASGNVNSTGYLTQVVNPLSFAVEGTDSPEGQSFIILAYSAFNEWVAMGSPGNTAKKQNEPLGKDSAGWRQASAGASIICLTLILGTSAWALV